MKTNNLLTEIRIHKLVSLSFYYDKTKNLRLFYKLFLGFLLVLASHSPSYSQDVKKDTIPGTKGKVDIQPETKIERKKEKRLYSISQFTKESSLFFRQPLRWKKNDWLKLGVIGCGVALLPFADQPLRNATQGDQHYYHSVPVEGGRIYGEWYTIGGLATIYEVYGLIAKDTASKKIGIELLQSGLYAETVTTLLKMAVGRARPYLNKGPGTFRPFIGINGGYNSFPSGHATSAMALSTVLARHADSGVLKVLAYVPAAFTLFSRIYQDKHWVSDELLGIGVGYFVGNWVVDLHEEKRHRINVTAIAPITISISLN